MRPRLDEIGIARRAAREFPDGAVVNMGYGMPGLCSRFVPEGRRVIFHTENGALGFGPALTEDRRDQWDFYLINASGQLVGWQAGMSLFDSTTSFGMIRGGHIDITVLGALQVSEKGDLANWSAPGRAGGMGGAMDLAIGARRIIVPMIHTTKDNSPKILKECTYPLTAKECVDLIVTDLAVIEVTKRGLVLKEYAPGWTVEEIQQLTEPRLIVAENLKEMEL
jgi:3-oxoacid CoA-transferase B subunit